MALTNEEKQKIKEEETYRLQVRAKNKNPTTAGFLVLFFGAFGWLYLNSGSRFFLYILVAFALVVLTLSPAGFVFLVFLFFWHIINIFWAVMVAKEMKGIEREKTK